ncbi:MAG: hypothetical protein R3C12_04345 [Planctomycetaceae bacterium]|nr:hypothetical protein [Planctomycetaceae bacterium]
MEIIKQEDIASKIERIENILLFVRSVDKAIGQADQIGPGGFAEIIGYKNFMGFGHTDMEPPLTPQEERFMHHGYMANLFHQRARRTPHEPISMDDSFLAASQGVFQVGKEKFPCAYFAACEIARFWLLANTANKFERWHLEKNLDPAKQPAWAKLTPPGQSTCNAGGTLPT